ncbi:MAG: 2Fe-2S iron-sulfur cluster-binding protein [bacterium]
MTDPIHFHTDLYRRDALELIAEQYRMRAHVELSEAGAHVVAHLEPLARHDAEALRDEFCNEAFSATARKLRAAATDVGNAPLSDAPPWALLAPFDAGTELGLGWSLDSLSPVRGGAAMLLLQHADGQTARVAIRRNSGAPLGVAHTAQLDFLVLNGGSGVSHTDGSISRVLGALAAALDANAVEIPAELLAALQAHAERQTATAAAGNAPQLTKRLTPAVDLDERSIAFEVDEAGVSRLALYDAVLGFADRCYVFLTRPQPTRIAMHIRPRGETTPDALRALAADVTRALNHALRKSGGGTRDGAAGSSGLPNLGRPTIDLEAIVAELAAADPTTVGLGFVADRGPGHENLRVLNIRGTGACNSECVFCIEKFNPTHRPMPSADATRQMIVDSAGRFDMLFFASGEPTIHPKLFQYVDLAKEVGFTCFGMSSHFRTFADPRFALKTLQAGFEYFDIALHAADLEGQLDVNPIEDDGQSLYEALQGLANLQRLAEALGTRISITHKIVVSRLNVTQLEEIFRATFERGVRHFILQPVRSLGLAPELQKKLEISEEEIMPHLNELLRRTEGLGAVVKPYGFSRSKLFAAAHIEIEQNRVKNMYGKSRERQEGPPITSLESRPTDGRHWVEIIRASGYEYAAYASDGSAPILDIGLQKGVDLRFGCRMGSCGMCSAKLLSGQVDQSAQIFLSEEQIVGGYVLLCQAQPLSDVRVQLCTDDEIDAL